MLGYADSHRIVLPGWTEDEDTCRLEVRCPAKQIALLAMARSAANARASDTTDAAIRLQRQVGRLPTPVKYHAPNARRSLASRGSSRRRSRIRTASSAAIPYQLGS